MQHNLANLCDADPLARVEGEVIGDSLSGRFGVRVRPRPVGEQTVGAAHRVVLALALPRTRVWGGALDEDVRRRIAQVTARQVSAVESQISDGDFMATHWLVSFAVQAELASSKY